MHSVTWLTSCVRHTLLAVLLASMSCLAQVRNPVAHIVVDPSDPQPTETISAFIRVTDPTTGFVLCPESSMRITGVTITGTSILLRLSNVGVPGGVIAPSCDGNTVKFGPLPAGQYTVHASIVLSSGTILPPLATAQLEVSPLENGRNYTALWGTASEQGWGLNVTHQGNVSFGTLFVYDDSGAPLWLVMPAGFRKAGTNTFAGDLYRTMGSPYSDNQSMPIAPRDVTRVGSMSVAFSDADAGTLTYSVDGRTVTKALGKAVFGSRPAACKYTFENPAGSPNYQALWWNEREPGWGLNITHQDDILFGTLFTYGPERQPLWLVMLGGRPQGEREYVGTLYQTSGPAFDNVWSRAEIVQVGEMRLQFHDGESGTLEYTVKGSTISKPITRQVFGNLVPSCH